MACLVSIVMATYNGGKFLKPQIESILNQTYSNFELVVVDDASTDGTLSILQDYAERDNRIQIHTSKQNIGLVANFERGVKLAKGEFIALSDQDDMFCEDKIELLVNKLKAFPKRDLVISDLSLIDSNGNKTHDSFWKNQKLNPSSGKPFDRLVYSNFATGCAMMFRRRLLDIALPFPEGILVHDWWLAIVATTESAGGLCLLNKKLTAYRQHGSNVIGAKEVHIIVLPRFNKLNEFVKSLRQINIRPKDYLLHLNRVTSYLQRDIWSESEIKTIKQVIILFDSYANINNQSMYERLLLLPLRLYYALLTKRLITCLGVLKLTFLAEFKKSKHIKM